MLLNLYLISTFFFNTNNAPMWLLFTLPKLFWSVTWKLFLLFYILIYLVFCKIHQLNCLTIKCIVSLVCVFC